LHNNHELFYAFKELKPGICFAELALKSFDFGLERACTMALPTTPGT
jgi:hypothetical protein